MTDVFISYAKPDAGMARRVARALQESGLEVWWDADLPAHRAYSEVIEHNLDAAKAVVVLWSANSSKSQWVRAEADVARNAGKLVQAQLDGIMPPIPFNQIQCADLKGWRGNRNHAGWSKLHASIGDIVGRDALAAAPPESQARWWRRPRLQVAAALALLLAMAAIWLALRWLGPGESERPVVAVLPFESLDRGDESLVAGIWEDTRQAIGRNPQLLVLGPNTAEEIADKGGGTARKLADYLVEASVRSVGDRIRVTANLVRTDDGSELWSKNFDRKLDDVFALQSEIAAEIEGHIRGRLAARGGVMPQNIATSGEVYALYSDARTKIRKRQPRYFDEAQKQIEQVVRMDPNFAPGWATHAVIKQMAGGQGTVTSAEADARRAVALAPNLAAAHAALGFVLGKGPAAQASLRRALDLDPNDFEAINWLANSLDKSQVEEKLRLYSRIAEIEPLWWPAIFNRTNLLFETGNFGALEKEIERLDSIGNLPLASMVRMEVMAKRNDLSGVVTLGLERYRQADEDERTLLGLHLFEALIQLGEFEMADKVFPPPSEYIPYIRRNDPKALDMIEAKYSAKQFWTYGSLPIVTGRVYLLNNQGPRMARRYREAARTPQEFEDLVGRGALPDVVPSLALALRSAGEDKQATELLALAEAAAKQMPPRPENDVALARIYAVAGRKDQALQLLSGAIRRGWLPPYLPVHTDIALDPPLAELKGDPRFEPLREHILRYLAKEKAELGPVKLS